VDSLPEQRDLINIVHEALDEAAPALKEKNNDCTRVVAEALDRRLNKTDGSIECSYCRGRGPDANEWMFDFVAGVWDPSDRNKQRFLRQALIVGEVEWHRDLEKDFEKLLIADSLVCFFAFPERVRERYYPDQDWLTFFHGIAEKRRKHAVERGVNPPPAFVIARYSNVSATFTYADAT
jgi:hypothetical protein